MNSLWVQRVFFVAALALIGGGLWWISPPYAFIALGAYILFDLTLKDRTREP